METPNLRVCFQSNEQMTVQIFRQTLGVNQSLILCENDLLVMILNVRFDCQNLAVSEMRKSFELVEEAHVKWA